MKSLKLTPFARAAFTRAARTMAQTALSLLGVKTLISDVDWKALISAVLMSGLCSILTSVTTDLPEASSANLPGASAESDNRLEVSENAGNSTP